MLGNVPLAAAFLARKPRATPAAYRKELEAHGWEATMALAALREGDIEAYGAASFAPALRAQWNMIDDSTTRDVLCVVVLHKPGDRVPIARVGLMTAVEDDANGIRTPLSDAVRDARSGNLLSVTDPKHVSMHAIVHDFIARQGCEDLNGEADKRVRTSLATLSNVAKAERFITRQGIDGTILDLLQIDRIAAKCGVNASILAEWLSLVQAHTEAIRAQPVPAESIADFG